MIHYKIPVNVEFNKRLYYLWNRFLCVVKLIPLCFLCLVLLKKRIISFRIFSGAKLTEFYVYFLGLASVEAMLQWFQKLDLLNLFELCVAKGIFLNAQFVCSSKKMYWIVMFLFTIIDRYVVNPLDDLMCHGGYPMTHQIIKRISPALRTHWPFVCSRPRL